jgi:lysophospholipase L1-like esterase
MKKKEGSLLAANTVLILATLILCLILSEIAIRLLFSRPEYTNRFLFWSSPHLVLDEHGAVRYLADETVRKISMYGNKIEYDFVYHTNNMGLVDTIDYEVSRAGHEADYRIALVGDSITAGSGGRGWIPVLREEIDAEYNGVELYNLGVSGAGIEHFYKLLKSVSSAIQFTDIVLIAISNDFQRPMWRPLTTPTEVRFCPFEESDEVCRKRLPVARVVDVDITAAQLVELSDKLITERAERDATEKSNEAFTLTGLMRNSRLFDLAYSIYHEMPLFSAGERNQRVSPALKHFVINNNIEKLREIRRQFPATNIYLIQLPERHEVLAGRYDRDIREQVEQMGVAFFPALHQCSWSVDMYHPHDLHPNNKGYENITQCVKGFLTHSVLASPSHQN